MSVAARHVVASLWRDALCAALAIAALALGVARALTHAGEEFEWGDALELLARLLPAVALFVAAAATLARLERERALVALMASGRSLRRVGLWLFLAGLPFAGAALAVELWPRARDGSSAAERLVLLEDGALLVRGLAAERAALVGGVAERAVAWGEVQSGARHLRVDAEWRSRGAPLRQLAPPRTRELAPALAALGGRAPHELDLAELERRLALHPRQPALRHARDARWRDALRPLVLLLLALGSCLRPFGRPFAARLCEGLALAFCYLALELWLGTVAAVGALPSSLGAFTSAALFGLLGATRWLRADHPP